MRRTRSLPFLHRSLGASNPARGIDTQTAVADKPAPTTGGTSPNKSSEAQYTATVTRRSFLSRLFQHRGS
jgi:hypothetical protein